MKDGLTGPAPAREEQQRMDASRLQRLAEIRERQAPGRPSREYYLEHFGPASYIFHDYEDVPWLLEEVQRLRDGLEKVRSHTNDDTAWQIAADTLFPDGGPSGEGATR